MTESPSERLQIAFTNLVNAAHQLKAERKIWEQLDQDISILKEALFLQPKEPVEEKPE